MRIPRCVIVKEYWSQRWSLRKSVTQESSLYCQSAPAEIDVSNESAWLWPNHRIECVYCLCVTVVDFDRQSIVMRAVCIMSTSELSLKVAKRHKWDYSKHRLRPIVIVYYIHRTRKWWLISWLFCYWKSRFDGWFLPVFISTAPANIRYSYRSSVSFLCLFIRNERELVLCIVSLLYFFIIIYCDKLV